MNTPILSKQLQKQSLSAKKVPPKALKNVLAQPQDSYWPVIPAEKCPTLEELLNELMPAIKRPSQCIPWSQLKHMKKEERIQAKKAAAVKETDVPNSATMSSIVLGINAVTRSLEKENLCCVLMDANIDPPLLIKHILQMALNKNLPILLLPKLKTLTLNTIGFAAAACALKNTVSDSPDHHFHPLYIKICDIFKDMPLPKNRLPFFKDDATSQKTMICDDEDKICFGSDSESDSLQPIKFTLSADVYVYRSSRTERTFIPPSGMESTPNKAPVKTVEQDNFISLSNYDSDEYDASIKKNARYINIHEEQPSKERKGHLKANNSVQDVKYLPLKVKRLQGNANRVKATKVSKHKKK